MLNEPQYIFGPVIPDATESVPIAFISAPLLKADLSVAVLSAERYVTQNYSHIERINLSRFIDAEEPSIIATYAGTTVSGLYSNGGTFSISNVASNDSTLKVLCSPIKVEGLLVSPAGTWNPVIKPGIVWRYHEITEKDFDEGTTFNEAGVPSNQETQTSWLARAGLKVGDRTFLIYTVPEAKYGPLQTSVSTTYPGTQAQLVSNIERAFIASPTKIFLKKEPKVITKVVVNDNVTFSGFYDGTLENESFESLDRRAKTVEMVQPVSPSDNVIVTYLSYSDSYVYTGFRTAFNQWYPFDANPEYGHIIGDWYNNELRNSLDCLQEQITLFLIPSAFVKVSNGSGPSAGSLILNFESAYNWNETHFVRHLVGNLSEDISVRYVESSLNTWGKAVFGKNYYDEDVGFSGDIFSKVVPSMMPLAKILIAAPASIKGVAMADIRKRGGGVPEDFVGTKEFNSAIATDSAGLDTLRGFFDLSCWEGAGTALGGFYTIEIVKTVLDEFTEDEIYEFVKMNTPPGVDFEIVYKDSV